MNKIWNHFDLFSRLSAVFLIVSVVFSPFDSFQAEAAVNPPKILSYQGRLANSSGDLLGGSGTTYYFKFSIWNTSSSGTRVWPTNAPQVTTATVRQGVFTVNIGDTAAGYPDALDYDFARAQDIYLQVEVSSDNISYETLTPRQRITSNAFAQVAGAVVGSTTPSLFGTTTSSSNSVVTIAATSTNSVALTIKAVTNQIARLFGIDDSAGNNLLYVSATGGLFASSTFQATGATRLYSTLQVDGASTLQDVTFGSGTSTGSVAVTNNFKVASLTNCNTIDTGSNCSNNYTNYTRKLYIKKKTIQIITLLFIITTLYLSITLIKTQTKLFKIHQILINLNYFTIQQRIPSILMIFQI
jgi:hypothetical protein